MSLDYIDTWAPDWWAQLTRLAEDKPAHSYLHLLADSAFSPGLHRALLKYGTWLSLFDGNPGDPEGLRNVSPWVGTWVGPSAKLHDALSACSGAPMLSAVITPEPLDAWAARLRPWCVVDVDGQWFNFRFPDTRRLPGIWEVLDERQQALLAGPAESWHYIGRDGHWHSLPGLFATSTEAASNICISEPQFAQIMADAAADEVLFRMMAQGRHQHVRHSLKHTAVSIGLRVAQETALDESRHVAWADHCVAMADFKGQLSAAEAHTALPLWARENIA